MRRLVFVDDDESELAAMGKIVEGRYRYVPIHWPHERPTDEGKVKDPPDIVVLDLYLPPGHGEIPATMPDADRQSQREGARDLAERLQTLYPGPPYDDKKVLRDTMDCIQRAYELLERQWRALGQDPENGIQLLRELKAHPRYGHVPVVFYSRKITPEDVVKVLQAGAVDAIRKGYPRGKESEAKARVLSRLDRAQHVYRLIRTPELNVNTTLFPE